MRKLIALVCAAALAGCVSGEKITSLEPGMTKAQVVKIMGKPDGFTSDGNTEVFKYTNKLISGWAWDKADYVAIFKNDRLTSYGSTNVRQNSSPVTPVLVTGNITTTRTN